MNSENFSEEKVHKDQTTDIVHTANHSSPSCWLNTHGHRLCRLLVRRSGTRYQTSSGTWHTAL